MKTSTQPSKKSQDQSGDEIILLDERSIYIEGVKVLQKQERISYFLTLVISLVMIVLLFTILMIA